LLLDLGEHGAPPVLELDEVGPTLFDDADLDLVEVARRLFPIAGDERYGRALCEEAHDRSDGRERQVQLGGELGDGIERREGGGLGHGADGVTGTLNGCPHYVCIAL
jgi:hypothetical protein